MKDINTFRCEVDLYRNGTVFRDSSNRLYDRNTKGVYFVGAKSADEAKELLQERIKFGSICVPYRHNYVPEEYQNLSYKEIVKLEKDCVKCVPDQISNNIVDENDKEEGFVL